jgi:hypothetical protein
MGWQGAMVVLRASISAKVQVSHLTLLQVFLIGSKTLRDVQI